MNQLNKCKKELVEAHKEIGVLRRLNDHLTEKLITLKEENKDLKKENRKLEKRWNVAELKYPTNDRYFVDIEEENKK